MGEIHVSRERVIQAPPDKLYGCIADYQRHHPHILPPAFSNLSVEAGGVGAGTIIMFQAHAMGQIHWYRMQVSEPEPGRVLQESDTGSSLVTTFTVSPEGSGARVRIATRWQPMPGFAGLMERLIVPAYMRRVYADELGRLDQYVRTL